MTDFQGLIQTYCEKHTTPADALLRDLERQTHLKTLAPQMVSGHLQGRLLSFISKMIAPSRILEIGTFTGYSALCLAEGLPPAGLLDTIEVNPEYRDLAQSFFSKSALGDKIKMHLGDALDLIPQLPDHYQLIFVDASKIDYQSYFDLAFHKVEKGGYMLFDNMLWSGKVVLADNDKQTKALRAFADMLLNHPNLESILLPIRDGLMLCRKK